MAQFLFREFCNHIYLGQWEFARACAINLMKNDEYSDEIKSTLSSTIQCLAKDPYLARSAWACLPCPSYVSLLSCDLLLDLGFEKESRNCKNYADFNILLEMCLGTPERVIKELSHIFLEFKENEDRYLSVEVTNECISVLKNAFKENPSAVSLLMRKMYIKNCNKKDFNLNSIFSNIHFQLLLNILKSAESFSKKNNKQLLENLIPKIYLLLSLLPDFCSEENLNTDLYDVFLSSLVLCKSDVLNLEKVYLSLLGRSSSALLKYFCKIENLQLASKSPEISQTSKLKFILDAKSVLHRESLFWSLHSETHFLSSLMENCINDILTGNRQYNLSKIKDIPVTLQNLLLILSWEKCSDDVSTMNVIQSMKMWNENEGDPVILAICRKFKLNISLTEMCLSTYVKLFPEIQPEEIQRQTRRILSLLQTQSLLRVLNSVFSLKNIPPDSLRNMLKHNQENLPHVRFSYLTDESIYSGYIVLVLIMEAIYDCHDFKNKIKSRKINLSSILYKTMETLQAETSSFVIKSDYENNTSEAVSTFINKYGCQMAYSKFIVEKIEKARQKIKELFPLSFRVEILENIFSMLFLMAQNLADSTEQYYDSDQGCEGEAHQHDKNDSFSINSVDTTEKRFEGRFVISTVKLKDTQMSKSDLTENVSDHISSKSTGSSSTNGIELQLFLCNELITRDLLSLLKDSVMEAKAEIFKLISRQDIVGAHESHINGSEIHPDMKLPDNTDLPERTSRLLQFINEAIWRYEVVKTDIFQERIHLSLQPRNKQDLFQSQPSTSSSDGTDREIKKHLKRKKHKRRSSFCQKDETAAESSIIQCMLSSPEALLRYSLWNGNLKQARQVIELFSLKTSCEAKELDLINELKQIASKLIAGDKVKSKSSKRSISYDGDRISSSSISSIKNAVAFGLHSSNLYMSVTEELSSLKVLKTMDITGGIRHPELLLGSKNIYSLLLVDLAYVSDISIELTSSLLDSANKSWAGLNTSMNELDTKVLSRKKMPLIRGNSKTLNMMNSFLKQFLLFLQENMQENLRSIFLPLKKNIKTLCQTLPVFMGNLDHQRFQEEVNNWKNTCSFIEEFSILLEKEELNEKRGVREKDIKWENKLHMTYKKLSQTLRELRDWSSRTICQEVTHYENYLSKLFIHLRQVTTAALECKSRSIQSGHATFYTSDFAILKESPVELLKKIILQSGITPEKIETFAIRMKVDLVRVLAQACLPFVPLSKQNLSVNNVMRSSCQMLDKGYPIYVLNTAREVQPEPKHPDLIARELLRDLISMIQETAMANDSNGIFKLEELLSLTKHSQLPGWMEECSQLTYIDLDLLQTREEKLAFFVNVTNIAWLYAILLQALLKQSQENKEEESEVPDYTETNGNEKVDYSHELLSSHILERLTAQKILGFSVGQLGAISLFDLRYQVLHGQLPVPKHIEASPLYKLMNGKNPLWEKYMPPLEPRVLFVLVEGLLFSPKLQVLYSEDIDDTLEKAMKDYFDFAISIDIQRDKVILPHLLKWYALDFSKDDDNCLDKAPYEGLINLLSSLVRPPLSQLFQELLSEDSAYNFTENIDSTGQKELPFTLEFKGPAASLGIMLEYSTPNSDLPDTNPIRVSPLLDPQPIIINYLKEKCHILTDLYEIIISGNTSQYLSELQNNKPVFILLKYYNDLNMTSDDSFSWFLSALSPFPDRTFLIQQTEFCFSTEKWHQAVLYLDIYLEHCGKKEFNLDLSRQLILEHIASINLSSAPCDASNYALCISDPLHRANAVLQNINKWSEHSALKALKYCLSDGKIQEFPDMHKSLLTKLREIVLYRKIVDASETYGSSEAKDCVYVFNNWQEVADCSLWDQSRILGFLNSCEKYELAVEWSELNVVNDAQKIVALSMNLLWYLSQDPPNEQALKILDSLEDSSDCLKLCDIVLPKLPIEAKLCLVQYVVDSISCDSQHHYHNMLLGLKMLSALKSPTKETCADLAAHPYLLLEQMLMNAELKNAEKALKAIENDLQSLTDIVPVMSRASVNQLVEDYASKALEVHFLDALLDTSSSSTIVLSIEDSFIVDEPFVMPARVPTKEEWVPDTKIHRCQVCKEERFNMFTRRHHCRRCGRVVCANCSQHALIVEGYGNVKVRVCDDCYNLMTGSIAVTSSSFDKRYRILSSMQSSPRNSPYQDNINIRRRNSSLHGLEQTFRWALSPDSEQNAAVRNEFSYEQAPSISLCYSILKLHSDPQKCAQFMLNLCDRLLGKIKPRRTGKIPVEVDYSLMISMIKSLLVSAKVKCHQVHYNEGEALADLYFQHLDIMKLLVNANCRHLIPREALTNSDTVRKLRDKLLEEERMSLALEVSTKFNLDKTGVWSSWGLFCIRAGDLPAARTKFQQCLKVIRDKNDPKQENPLLNKILQVLETSKYAGTEKAVAIYKALSHLKNIENGSNWLERENSALDGLIQKECLYYLNAYGTHFSVVRFYQRNNLTQEALKYILEKKCEPDVFIDAIFIPMLKNVQLSSLKHDLTNSDPTLSLWWNYLFGTCRQLERLKYFNVLYEMQLFMEDYVRAAKSAINFYLAPASSYKELFERQRFLYNAKKHYEKALKDVKEFDSASLSRRNKNIKMLPIKELESYIETITVQEEVSRFFQQCMAQNNQAALLVTSSSDKKEFKKASSPPTLFGNSQKKFELSLMVILNAVYFDDGFELAIKIIQTFGLDATTILCEAGKELVRKNQQIQIPHFLACVKCFFSKMVKVDEIILEIISEISKQNGDVEGVIKMLISDANKINAYLMCDKLKSAYLLAIKLKSALDIRRVLVAAEQSGQTAIQQICKKWLESNSQTKSK